MVPKLPAAVVHAGVPPASNASSNVALPPFVFTTLTSYGSSATVSTGVVNTISVVEFTVVLAALICAALVHINFTTSPA